MATIKCSACSNDVEIEISNSIKSIQCPVCSEWIKVRNAGKQIAGSNGITELSADRNSRLITNVVLGLKSLGFFNGWIRFLLAGVLIVILALVMNGFSVLTKKQSAELERQQELIERLKLELSSIKGVNSSNENKVQSEGVFISEFRTQVQLYESKKPDIVEYIGEVKNNTKQKISECVVTIGFYQYGSNVKLSEEKVDIGTLSAGETARFRESIKLIDTMLSDDGSGPDSDSGRARVIGFQYGSKSDQRQLPVAGKTRSDDSRRF
jgi:DNA-directed RNA polymerase subunit RPC12/RpoP